MTAATTAYRAAYFLAQNGNCTLLTGPEHAHLTDDELCAEALAEAQRGDIIDMDETDPEAAFPRITREQFVDGLHIGEWTE